MTKLRLGVHSLRIQTGKYENKGSSIPVEEKLCLVCRRNYIENEKHFLMHYMKYDNLRQKLYLHISENDTNFDTRVPAPLTGTRDEPLRTSAWEASYAGCLIY